jgi:hypothetical protein
MRAFLLWALLAFPVAGLAQPSPLDKAYQDVVAARAALQRAEEARERGAEPLPGERTAVAGGKGRSRLNEQYTRRQERLEKDVELARKRLDEATTHWNSLK